MSDKIEKTPTWGYSAKGNQIFHLAEGEKLPKGFHAHPAMVPGSAAEAAYHADAEREGALIPWTGEEPLSPNGPTIEEFLAKGYKAKDYPPNGFAAKSTPEEIAAAVAAADKAKA